MTILLGYWQRAKCFRGQRATVGMRVAAALALGLTVGCRPAEQIESYTVPKESRPRITSAARSAEPTDRMLVAILPDGERAWFLKVVGPLSEIDRLNQQIMEFFSSVRAAPGKPHPNWHVPNGWTEQPGSGMRAATLHLPTDEDPLELTVTTLPWSGNEAELLSNVNRWREQMQLGPIGAEGLAECARELTVDGTTMTVVDLHGRMQSTGMMPPFAGGFPPAGASSADLPAGHPPIAAGTRPQAAQLSYESPDDWQPLPATGMRKAAFGIVAAGSKAEVTVIDFSADAPPMMSDPLANVNRWRAEVGLDTISNDQLATIVESLEMDGVRATYVEAVPDGSTRGESLADRATLAAMATSGDKIWFFKLTGDRDLVAAQRDKFKSFLKSVRFNSGGESTDGN